jgi:iron complex outermembrane receptor protein
LRIKREIPGSIRIGPGIFFCGPGKRNKDSGKECAAMSKRMATVLLATVLLSVPVMSPLCAQEGEPEITLEEVVVTAARAEQSIEKVPANVTVIDEKDIKNSNARSVVDLLRSEEGIVVRDLLGNGKRSEVDLRGFGETGPYNTLVLVDGRRVNEIDLSGVDWTQIALDNVERIEIVRGTGTVLYGDNAVGGVINIITKIPSEKPSIDGSAILGSYSRHKEAGSLNAASDRIGASLFASYDSSDGYRDNGEFRARDVGGKLVFDATESMSLNLSGSYHSDEYGLAGDLTEIELAADRRATADPLDEGKSRDGYLNLGFDVDLGEGGGILTEFSYRERKNRAEFPDPLFPYITDNKTKTWALTPRYTWSGEILDHGNTLIAGVDLYWSEQDLQGFSGFLTPVAVLSDVAAIERDSIGYYLHDEHSVLENLILTLGARRERVGYDLKKTDLTGFLAPLDETVTERENAYEAGLTYLYNAKSSVFVRANRSVRFPLTDEVVVSDYIAMMIRVNTELKPQKGRHYEVGVRHFFTPVIRANVTLFRAEIKDEIFLNRFPSFNNENHPETLHQGVEVGAKADLLKKMTIFGNYTFEKATFEKDPFKGNDIPAVPRHRANLGFRIYDMVPGLTLSADYNYVGSSYAISDQANQFDKLDSWATINARISYEWNALKAFFGVNNITNEEYSEYAVLRGVGSPTGVNFYPAPERNWLAGIEIVF